MNNTAEDEKIIQSLDKPGAGVPFFELMVMKFYYGPFVSKKSTWDDDSKAFAAINRKVLAAVEAIPAAQLQTRVLVPKLQGLEDSSRYWSAAMTLEHIMIVGKGMAQITKALSNGVVPQGRADTASVKPRGAGDAQSVIADFRRYTDTMMTELDAAVKDRQSKLTFRHPWFGPFTAHQWHWLLAVHSALHLKQIREIAKRLPAA